MSRACPELKLGPSDLSSSPQSSPGMDFSEDHHSSELDSLPSSSSDAAETILVYPEWPHLTTLEGLAIASLPILTLIACIVWLRYIWPPSTASKAELQPLVQQSVAGGVRDQLILNPGEVNLDADHEYRTHWTKTFDLAFLLGMIATFIGLSVWTQHSRPDLWSNGKFWLLQTPKVGIMIITSVLGGLLARRYSDVDERGYCFTRPGSWFKVNYTRKLQHFAAYMVPLVVPTLEGVEGPLFLFWGDFFTMLGFLVMIKPIRERFTFFMLQFNALDRPEDRPNTLKWILLGNIIPGLLLIILFRYILTEIGADPGLAMIFIFITGIGDGFAEPVGILWGEHKYKTRAIEARCCRDLNERELELLAGEPPPLPIFSIKKYTRSYEGSVCLLVSGVAFTAMFYTKFANPTQFWMCMLLMPIPMTLAEAWSPHTMDTPFLMLTGGLVLTFVTYFF